MPTDVQPMYDKLMSVIEDIDIKLDSLDDSSGASKRKIASDLVEAHKTTWEPAVKQVISQFQNLDEETLVGVFRGFVSELTKTFDEPVKNYIEKQVENAPKSEPLITEEEAEVLSKQRSDLYQQIKMAVQLAESIDGVELAMPKTRRGSRGKRGPRAMSLMVWSIDGVELDPQPEKFKDLATLVGFEKSSELTAFLKSKDVDTTNPENGELEVTLEDGRTLSGYIPAEDDEDESDED